MSLNSTPAGAPQPPLQVAIAYCSDSMMEVPLHVSALALLNHLAPGIEPHFYMLLTEFTAEMQALLRKTLDRAGRPYRLTFLSDEKTKVFNSFRSLLGNFAPYYRLLLPDLIEEPTYLYIDSDTLPMLDVSPVFEADMGSYAAGFVVDGHIRRALESTFFQSIGLDPEGPAFNSGVMLVQREEWKKQNYWNRLMEFCEKYPDNLQAADQTALVAVMATNCYHLPPRFNAKVWPRLDSKIGDEPGLYHFVGSPKPWDCLARTILPYSKHWFRMLDQTALPFAKKRLWLQGPYWKRAPRVLGGYYRLVKNALKNR